MKHNVAQLHTDANDLVRRYREREAQAKKDWFIAQEKVWRDLRNMITRKLKDGSVITVKDVNETAGDCDLDRWYNREGGDARVFRSTLGTIANLRQTRPRGHISVTFSQLVAFRDLVATLPGEEVSDAELTDLGFSRFPAVVSRLTRTSDENLGVTQEIY
ncbi:hypothetical protein KNU02_gp12 [Gordonia phage Pleakley]|uniref:Uncharacterized protein n=1 Tax=Gordonia phage Pleakley TaxID=2283246 RepID=A0A345M6D0_9CAUD|nr:hypothetical protein KNU02_gp12 [Gordonia phage Pleakley]AXH49738.1 hypothetical protein SEA_FURY_12 [Gordonia phage Fury]AXH66051.1 hypothetical protein SEA_PLEAKLEY_12 [Gordonia phage Pleakley]